MPIITMHDSTEYSKMNDFMRNHLELMDQYGKPTLIHDMIGDKVYVNVHMESLFASHEDYEVFLENLSTDEDKKVLSFYDEATGVNLIYNLRNIYEKETLKYKICTIDKIIKDDMSRPESQTVSAIKDIIGDSEEMDQIKRMIQRVSKSDSTVLLTGHTGTGKEMFAHTIHKLSERSHCSFVVINCGAIPETLIESELFGYEKGAFTGANQKGKIGKFEQADGGTLFLDEIENMSVFLQMKILRVLEERAIVKVGGLTPRKVDVRILAATNIDLKDMVERGEFRRDLYYRLNIIQIKIPDLHDRGRDVLEISQHFIKQFNQRMKRQIMGLSKEVTDLFLHHHWDGNVRELRNVIEYAMNFEDSPWISKGSLPDTFFESGNANNEDDKPIFRPLEEIEREEIQKALDYFGWDDKGKKLVAKALNISRSSIYRKVLYKEKNND